jgi:hypothetical protein
MTETTPIAPVDPEGPEPAFRVFLNETRRLPDTTQSSGLFERQIADRLLDEVIGDKHTLADENRRLTDANSGLISKLAVAGERIENLKARRSERLIRRTLLSFFVAVIVAYSPLLKSKDQRWIAYIFIGALVLAFAMAVWEVTCLVREGRKPRVARNGSGKNESSDSR